MKALQNYKRSFFIVNIFESAITETAIMKGAESI